MTLTQYTGKVCGKHPDLGGLRRRCNRKCVGCGRDEVRAKAKVRLVISNRYVGPICALHPELKGLRRSVNSSCVGCSRDRSKLINKSLEGRRRHVMHARLRGRWTLHAKPSWASWNDVRKVYDRARVLGKVVDHIVPLKHELVCGLHCPDNFRIVAARTNGLKGNRFQVE